MMHLCSLYSCSSSLWWATRAARPRKQSSQPVSAYSAKKLRFLYEFSGKAQIYYVKLTLMCSNVHLLVNMKNHGVPCADIIRQHKYAARKAAP